jgi:hypothetical protein
MCFSVAIFYNFFLCGKRAFLCGESNSSKINVNKFFQKYKVELYQNVPYMNFFNINYSKYVV